MTAATADTDARPLSGELRILVENSEYWLLNMGDLAMLDVTLRRLRTRFPEARIGVLTDTPSLLRAYFPGVEPIVPHRSSAWSSAAPLARVCQVLGPRVVGPLAIGWLTGKVWLPQKARGARRRALRLLRSARTRLSTRELASEFTPDDAMTSSAIPLGRLLPTAKTAAASSSLVVALGGGYLTDADPWQSNRLLNLLEHAANNGVPTAMLGQGIGPIDEPALTARAAEVLPGVEVIALREGRKGPALLERAGVPTSRVAVTGDDAIELAHSQRPEELGSDIGVCLRIAGYSPVDDDARAAVAASVRSVADEFGAGLAPVVIAEYRNQDRRSTLPLVQGYEAARKPLPRFARPQDVAAQVGRCRVMVTGAYHAAVFALSQGIPVVALTSSTYYDDKFLGLAGMFDTGLELVRLDEDDPRERLTAAIRSAWKLAPDIRPALLASAAEQIALSRKAFDRVCDLV
jgi:polysaccharide pyruvyl transferase WcaK-like protein